jgi:hypothetical protein
MTRCVTLVFSAAYAQKWAVGRLSNTPPLTVSNALNVTVAPVDVTGPTP